MTAVLWKSTNGAGLERCLLEETRDGYRLSGTCLLVAEDAPHEIRYSVLLDGAWRTRTVGADIQSHRPRRSLALSADGNGNWTAGDAPLLDFFGAVDIDLAWTPATTTISIARLALDVGASAEITVAHVAFPEHDIGRRSCRYTRIDETTYERELGGVVETLTVDDTRLVTQFGDRWVAIALG